MRPWARDNVFTVDEIRLSVVAADIVSDIHNPPKGHPPWRCHEVARVVAAVLEQRHGHKLQVVDGYYASAEHTWLLCPERGRTQMILDVYAVARLPMVQLVDSMWPRTNHPYDPTRVPDITIDESAIKAMLWGLDATYRSHGLPRRRKVAESVKRPPSLTTMIAAGIAQRQAQAAVQGKPAPGVAAGDALRLFGAMLVDDPAWLARAIAGDRDKTSKKPQDDVYAALDAEYDFYLTDERKVTAREFCTIERAEGFQPKEGCGPLATAGFSRSTGRGSISGRMEPKKNPGAAASGNTPPEEE